MSDTNDQIQVDEKTLLKEQARKLGIPIQGNPSVETLRSLIEDKKGSTEAVKEAVNNKGTDLAKLRKEAQKLIRVRIQNMNPNKKNMRGEIFSVGNRIIGTIKKFIPYSPESHPDGYHVPQALLNELQSRQFQYFREEKKGNQSVHKAMFAKEFAIEILPPLTKEELEKLAKLQHSQGTLE